MKIQRLIAILTALLQTNRISATRLAEMFEVSVRTIYRDVEALESAGIPMVTYPGANGGVGIVEQYKIDKKLFTHQDMSTLLTSLHSVSGSISGARLNQTLEKIRGLIPAEQVKAIELSARQLYIDMTPWANHPLLSENLELIRAALESSRLLAFGYMGRAREPSQRKVEPHQLVLKENNWYLRAFCLERQAFRVFKLRRMERVHRLEETFTPRDFPTEMTDFKDWTHKELLYVELLVDESLRDYLLDKCREDEIEPAEGGKLRVYMPFVESDLGYGHLMNLGSHCECVGPAHIREELVRRIDEMRAVYNT